MLITKEVEVTWTNNRKIYEPKGYVYTKQGEKFIVKIEDLALNSHIAVIVKCDYCGKEYPKPYSQFNSKINKKIINKDACDDCRFIKTQESNLLKYNVPVPNQLINNFKDIEKQFLDRDLKLLQFNEKIVNKTYLSFICEKHKFKIQKVRFEDFKNGCGCTYCSHEKQSLSQLIPIDLICKNFEDRGYIVIGESIKNKRRYIDYVCSNHLNEIQSIALSSFNQGHGCKYCHYDNISGENHPAWKGGITPLHNYLRQHILQWKKDSLLVGNYCCVFTGGRINSIHHLYGFDLILEELIEYFQININLREIKVENLSQDELKQIEEKCLELHYKYGLGVCLSKEIHNLFHRIYGYGKNTPEQFKEFTQRYYNGEFINTLNEVSA